MNIYQKKITQKLTAIFAIIMLVSLAFNSAKAQKAPDFSNDLMMGNQTYVWFIADRLEYNMNSGLNPLVFDAQGFIGKDFNKFWFKAEGEALTAETEGEMEFQGLYSRAITAYFDVQAGIRYDIAYTRAENQTRGLAVIGLQGVAPYLFEVDGSIAVSDAGNISASFEAEYDFPITQRLWGQPRLETSAAVQEVPEWGVGSGLNNIGLGFRLRYEFAREFAPYLGISWNRQLGETADFVRAEGESASTVGMVGGVRMWF